MKTQDQHLGGRLPLLNTNLLNDEQNELQERISSTLIPWASNNKFLTSTEDDSLIDPFNACPLQRGCLFGLLEWIRAESVHTSLDKRVREVVILSVGAVWRASYELYAHTAIAREELPPPRMAQKNGVFVLTRLHD